DPRRSRRPAARLRGGAHDARRAAGAAGAGARGRPARRQPERQHAVGPRAPRRAAVLAARLPVRDRGRGRRGRAAAPRGPRRGLPRAHGERGHDVRAAAAHRRPGAVLRDRREARARRDLAHRLPLGGGRVGLPGLPQAVAPARRRRPTRAPVRAPRRRRLRHGRRVDRAGAV
ncbi:MAG: hypothetical protein AVDCRST_MAG11-2857, partial [uncultured Gemmatimonadaceae bacterium]